MAQVQKYRVMTLWRARSHHCFPSVCWSPLVSAATSLCLGAGEVEVDGQKLRVQSLVHCERVPGPDGTDRLEYRFEDKAGPVGMLASSCC